MKYSTPANCGETSNKVPMMDKGALALVVHKKKQKAKKTIVNYSSLQETLYKIPKASYTSPCFSTENPEKWTIFLYYKN